MAGGDPTASDGHAASPVIDRSVLGEWLAGDDAAIDELLIVFSDSVRAEQDRLGDLAARNDLTEYASTAHRLRGAALSMGARALAEVAGALYAAAQRRDQAVCLDGLEILDRHVRLMLVEVPPPRGDAKPPPA